MRGAACGLEDAKLSLELHGVATVRLEGVADGLFLEAACDREQVFDPRQLRHRRRRLARCSWSLYRHSVPPRLCRAKYARCIGRDSEFR